MANSFSVPCPPSARQRWRPVVRCLVLLASAYGLSAVAQVSVGAAAAASAPGASSSANGGTGGVGLGGVGPGVTVNPGVNAGAGIGVQGRDVGNAAISGPRARGNARSALPPETEVPRNSGQRAIALDEAARARQNAVRPEAPAAVGR